MERFFDWLFDHFGAVLWFLAAGVVAMVVVVAVQSCQMHSECEAKGGHVEKYDCQTMYVKVGQVLVPEQMCNERCVP